MIAPTQPPSGPIHSSDLDELYQWAQSMQIVGDNQNIEIDHNSNGVTIKFTGIIGGDEGGGAGTQLTFLAKIKAVGAQVGIYTVDIYNNGFDEDPTESDVEATPTLFTFTPLAVGDKCVVMKTTIETLGDNVG